MPLTKITSVDLHKTQPLAPVSAADELAKMAQLRTQGMLTDEEFTAAKTRILGV